MKTKRIKTKEKRKNTFGTRGLNTRENNAQKKLKNAREKKASKQKRLRKQKRFLLSFPISSKQKNEATKNTNKTKTKQN